MSLRGGDGAGDAARKWVASLLPMYRFKILKIFDISGRLAPLISCGVPILGWNANPNSFDFGELFYTL